MSSEGGRERLGILGGTFDPPHVGHVAAARSCREQLRLDRVLFVVAHDPWQKSPQRAVSAVDDRLAMVTAAVEDVPGAEVSRLEVDRGGPSYTVETAEALAGIGDQAPELFLIVGADVADTLATWHRPADLARLVTLAVVARPGVAPVHRVPGWRVEAVPGTPVDVSSSQIRSLVAAGEPITGLVPASVEQCIRSRGLYAVGR